MNKKLAIVSLSLTFLFIFIIGGISIYLLTDYGYTIFCLSPILLGFIPPYIYGKKQTITKTQSYSLSFLTLTIICFGLLIFAIEGLICIAMSLPLAIPLIFLGSYWGFKINEKKWINPTNTKIGIILLCLTSVGFDSIKNNEILIPVQTTVIVNAPIQKVWINVVTFGKIKEPTDWIFKTGISCPTDATIKGTGVGAIRYCNFTTGSFIEPITMWNEPELLQFNVTQQPIPMNEMNPFWDIQPPHLKNHFLSKRGQFKLIKKNEKQTELEGTTFYELHILPKKYWKIWSDFIIHRIHKRVLNHIKTESEKL
ncbi:hypothetical protein N9901_02320 [Flavobacteriaceae bacterium]|nr:hypothetical protein [Flavobacteriaceae bacterium]